ncbi:MAG: peptide chain release factor 1 [Flavobacteriaceae bacterium]|nr:peptide chain release factor 1 [Flavobacteriaceae bacterium]
MLLEKIEIVEKRYDEIYQMISNPDIIADQKKYIQLNKELKELSKLVETGKLYKNAVSQKIEAEEYLNSSDDEDMTAMAKEQLDLSKEAINNLEEEIKILLIPKDPEDSKNVVVEIRAGTGGDEASIFAGDLYRMYTKFAQDRKWKISVVDTSEGNDGGFKEVIFEISGQDVYGVLKYESGVHRVQRVPQTETQGRVHTSAATVMVLPEAEEFDVEINMSEVRVDYFCSSGPGGQSVNTTLSAVRLTHEPTGVVAQCQDQKSQHKNYDQALKVLRSRIYEMELQKKLEEDAKHRKTMVSSGDRSAKIRTYNYPQGRVTEHRIGLTKYNLQNVMGGEIQEFIDELQLAENAEKLKEGTTIE